MSISQSVSYLSGFRTQPCLVNLWGAKTNETLLLPVWYISHTVLVFFHQSVHLFIVVSPSPIRFERGQPPRFIYKFKSKTNPPTQIMSNATEALGGLFASLPPSPEYASFWSGPFEHFAFCLIVVWFAYQDEWRKVDITECLGRIIVISMFGLFSHQYLMGTNEKRRPGEIQWE